FREGLESFLIIAIMVLTLQKARLHWLLPAIYSGIVLSVTGSIALGIVLAQIGQLSPFWEAWLAIFAAIAVIWCVVHMLHAGHGIAAEITNKLETVATRSKRSAWLLVFGFTVFMIAREGVETATMIASLAAIREAQYMAVGGMIGFTFAVAACWLWVKLGRRIQLRQFFKITAWMMGVFALQLLILAFHEFTEANAILILDNAWWHLATENLAEGWIGQLISISLIAIPAVWLMANHVRARSVPYPQS
ncbi:MAG: FTR1 family protein, partial [Nitrosomonadales bacterium]|nr:FTR1 family protein [Nitrosomonadales bacterium]